MQKRLQFWLPMLAFGLILVFIGWFKVGNTDFWWHIKAGEVLRTSGWIKADPFAYTREGLPYLANHEWLAQIILSLLWGMGGVLGITLFRIACIVLTVCVPLLLHKKNIWINGAFVVLAAIGARPAFTDRPQLLSFVFFSLITCLCITYLETAPSRRKRIIVYLPIGIALWSNLHGAASLMGIAVIGALIVQRFVSGALKSGEWKWLLALVAALFLALLCTPSGTGNIAYVINLLTDNTASAISEWQPAAWNIYLQHTLALWIASLFALFTTRRNLLFSTLVLLGLGYLSRTAVRHEALFVIAALAITVYQLRYNKRWNALIDAVYASPKLQAATLIPLVLVLSAYVHVRQYDINRIDNLFGFGVHEPARGAYAFLEEQNIEGPMFNNYNIGGELLYRGYPNRKVFVDGRNIDYGYDFLTAATNAGVDETVWRALENEYGFTHAVIYYDLQADQEPIPYVDLLHTFTDWHLAYLDDWVAVYTKEGQKLTHITPKMLHRQIMPEQMGQAEFEALQNELNHMIELRPDGIKARLYLARLYMLLGAYEPSQVLLNEALEAQPNAYAVYIGIAQLHMEKGEWPKAWYYLKKAKRKAGYTGVKLDQNMMDAVREQAHGAGSK